MTRQNFTGFGSTYDEALTAASTQAAKAWKPDGIDDQLSLQVDSVNVLYGGIAGHIGTRVVTVSAVGAFAPSGDQVMADAAPTASQLSCKLEVMPDTVWVDMMPSTHSKPPQPRKVGITFIVANHGTADYNGTSPDAAVARIAVMNEDTMLWQWPQGAAQMVTPIKLRPGESKTYIATWDTADLDLRKLLGAELHVIAHFVPSGDSAMRTLKIKGAF